jgi:hypothetical protein
MPSILELRLMSSVDDLHRLNCLAQCWIRSDLYRPESVDEKLLEQEIQRIEYRCSPRASRSTCVSGIRGQLTKPLPKMDSPVKQCAARDLLVDFYFVATRELLFARIDRKLLLTDHSSQIADARLCLVYCSVNEREFVAVVMNAWRSNVLDVLLSD